MKAQLSAPTPARSADADGPRATWRRAESQRAAVGALAGGLATRGQRSFLINEIRNQVPDVAYMEQVAAGARTVLTLTIPGNGPLGVKTLNDDVVGYQINNTMIAPQRNDAVKQAFLVGNRAQPALRFAVTEQTYKSTIVTSMAPPHQVGAAMPEVLHAIDRGVQPVYLGGLAYGLDYWTNARNDTPADTDAHREATRRIRKIEQAIELVEPRDFQLDFQFGLAAVERRPDGRAPSYAAALAARMHSSQAALMSRDLERDPTPETSVGDPRGQIYDRNAFSRFCEEGEALRREVIRSGNTLTHHGHQYRVFTGNEANRDVVRDVRKEKVKEGDLATDEAETLRLFKRYFLHVNAFDSIRQFTSSEVGQVGEQIQRAQRLIESLKGGRPVNALAVSETLQKNPGMREVVPTAGTASEAVFYNAEWTRTNRIIVSCDVRDMGVDVMQNYEGPLHRVGGRHEDPDPVAQQASDPMVRFRRPAIRRIRGRYRALVLEAIKAARRRGDHELTHQLGAEIEPSLLMGGDEITLSLHEAMRPYVARLAAALIDPKVARARVAISTTGSKRGRAVDDHILALQRADPAHSVLKDFEAEQRALELMVEDIGDAARRGRAAALVRELKLNVLYAENEGQGIVLRRSDTSAVVDAGALRQRIRDVERWVRASTGG